MLRRNLEYSKQMDESARTIVGSKRNVVTLDRGSVVRSASPPKEERRLSRETTIRWLPVPTLVFRQHTIGPRVHGSVLQSNPDPGDPGSGL